jgi:hypothetical protein
MRYILLAAIFLAGCGSTLIVLKNPQNGQIVQCSSGNSSQFIAQNEADNCAKAYEREGYQRISN